MSKFDNHRELSELVYVSESLAFKEVLKERKEYLQGEVNKFVRGQLWTESFGALSKLDDIDKMMKMVNDKIFKLRKESTNG